MAHGRIAADSTVTVAMYTGGGASAPTKLERHNQQKSPHGRHFIAKVRFRPNPGSRRRTATGTKLVQDESTWGGSKLLKTLYNCFTIDDDSAMPRFRSWPIVGAMFSMP